jgi:hypothetical protein
VGALASGTSGEGILIEVEVADPWSITALTAILLGSEPSGDPLEECDDVNNVEELAVVPCAE